jgi:hypothetical protein
MKKLLRSLSIITILLVVLFISSSPAKAVTSTYNPNNNPNSSVYIYNTTTKLYSTLFSQEVYQMKAYGFQTIIIDYSGVATTDVWFFNIITVWAAYPQEGVKISYQDINTGLFVEHDSAGLTDNYQMNNPMRTVWKFEITNKNADGDNYLIQYPTLATIEVRATNLYEPFGYSVGYNDGRDVGFDQGFDQGKTAGIDEGYTNGKTDGYTEGYNAGVQAQNPAIYDDGYNAGYKEGSEKSFMSNLDKWIVPAIITVMVLGAFVSIRIRRNG